MMRDDALLAFERHATSKLSDVKDLLSIATLGFRGEALPSIASVSRLLLETRAREETVGTTVEIAGGKILRCDRRRARGGTIITVRDLVLQRPGAQKIPALRANRDRARRFADYALQPGASRQELSAASQQFGSLRCNPGRHAARARLSGLWQPDARRSDRSRRSIARTSLCPRTTSREARDDSACAASSAARRCRSLNRNSIYLFVNGRLIRDRLLLHALSSAYHNLMPPACYPFALLFLDCDLRRSRRQRASLENRSSLPPRIVGPRFRARHHSRCVDGAAPRRRGFHRPRSRPR